MAARYTEGLTLVGRTDPRAQGFRYDNLARFMHKVSTVHGRHQYSQTAIRRSLAASRVLTKNGEVRQERLQKWARSRGIKANLTTSNDKWNVILDGGS